MNPQQTTPPDPFTEPATTPSVYERPTEQTTPPVEVTPKKSHKRAIVMLILGLILIIGAIGAYAYYLQASTPATNMTTESTTAPVEKTSPVEATTEVITNGIADESTLSETNDTTEINDADNAAGTVGESVNENNL